MEDGLTRLTRLLKALTDPTRLRILGLLQGAPVCVCHIHESLGISQPKASRHLAYLRRAGVVATERRGTWVHYRLAAPDSADERQVLAAALRTAAASRHAPIDRRRLAQRTSCVAPALLTRKKSR
jgi:ArsR family transcriptional regulator